MTCRAEDEETRKTELRNFESARNDADDEVFTLPGYTVELDKIPEAERTEEQRLEAEDLRLDELEDQDAKKIAQEITAAADVEKATSLVDELAQRNQFEVELEGAHTACAPWLHASDWSGILHWNRVAPVIIRIQSDDRDLLVA